MDINNMDTTFMDRTKIITITSGKGGAGKTIFSFALSHLINTRKTHNSCVILDLDFHVKGLTLLWYKDLNTLTKIKFSTYDSIILNKNFPSDWAPPDQAETVIIPAYQNIRKPINYDTLTEISLEDILDRLSSLLKQIQGKTDFIIIDTRAGIDNYSLVASVLADMTIIISEQDRISFRACFDLQSQIMLTAEKLRKFNSKVKGNLPFYVYNKVVDPRLTATTIDTITHLPPIKFDHKFYEEFLMNTHELLASKQFKQSPFNRDLSGMLDSIYLELDFSEKKILKKKNLLVDIIKFYSNIYNQFKYSITKPINIGVFISLFIFIIGIVSYARLERHQLNSQILNLEGRISAFKQARQGLNQPSENFPYQGNALLVTRKKSEIIIENISRSPIAIRISWDGNDPYGTGTGKDSFINNWVPPGMRINRKINNHNSAQIWAWGSSGALIDSYNLLLIKSNFIINVASPQKGTNVGREVTVKGTALIPKGNHLWVLARRADFAPLWWPQREAKINPKIYDWSATANFGGPQDIGWDFDIGVITVNEDGHRKLMDYWVKSMSSGDWKPIQIPETTSIPHTIQVKKVNH